MTDTAWREALESRRAPLEMSAAEFRELGHHLVERIAGFLESLPERPAAPRLDPEGTRARIGQGGLPAEGAEAKALLDRAADLLFDGCRLNGHPRSWGYIIGSPAPIGILADFLAAAVNPNLAAWNSAPVPSEIEAQTVRWVAELLGYPTDCGGLLVSGGNMANFVGVLAARRAKAPWDLRREGLAGRDHGRLRAYVSAETHTWVQKAADLFGLGTDAIRWIPTDQALRMRADLVRERIAADRATGDLPFLIVGTAGTVSTGAVDPLPELAAIAREEGLWFHVDGAYGAPAVAAENPPADIVGLREADSLAIDAHKWLYVPLEAGCVLVRDKQMLRDTFSYRPPYYHHKGTGEAEVTHYYEYGPQNSRCFRALKVWLALQRAGQADYARMIADDIALAEALRACLAASPDLEVATRSLSITTFRYRPADLDPAAAGAEDYLNALNTALLTEIQRGGEAFLSNAIVAERFLLRACITNFRSTAGDAALLPGIVTRIGRRLDRDMRPAGL